MALRIRRYPSLVTFGSSVGIITGISARHAKTGLLFAGSEIGSRNFAAQYQQNPTPPEGNLIKASWLARYQLCPPRQKFNRVVLSCDPAGKANIKNDYTAIIVVGVSKRESYLLQVSRGHWTVLEMRVTE